MLEARDRIGGRIWDSPGDRVRRIRGAGRGIHSLITAWAGGPRVAADEDCDARIARGLNDLRQFFGSAVEDGELIAAHVHDWQSDPYARGAYGYVKAHGGAARRQLAEPVEDTLFFCGEAADTGGEAGTVAGDLQSGERAARDILRSVYHR